MTNQQNEMVGGEPCHTSGAASLPNHDPISFKPKGQTNSAPPSSASAPTPAVFYPAVKKPYSPDSSAIASQIVEHLLSDEKAENVCDAIVQTWDNARVPVCSCLLSIRSSHFKHLFGKAERGGGRTEVKVDITKWHLRHMLQFWYSGQSDLAQRISRLIRERSEIAYDDLLEIVELMQATDILSEPKLFEWLNDIVEDIVRIFPSTACVVLQICNDCVGFPPSVPLEEVIHDTILENPHECFGVPKIAAHAEQITSNSNKEIARNGLLKFTAQTLNEVLSLPFASRYQEYLFGVLYYWTTNGKGLSPGAPPPVDTVQQCVDELAEKVGDTLQCQSRYAMAKKLVKELSFEDMSVNFLLDYVQSTEVVESKLLLKAMRCRLGRDLPVV